MPSSHSDSIKTVAPADQMRSVKQLHHTDACANTDNLKGYALGGAGTSGFQHQHCSPISLHFRYGSCPKHFAEYVQIFRRIAVGLNIELRCFLLHYLGK